jgi:hypothetical protein
MTQAEYVRAISSINEASGQALVGSSGFYPTALVPARDEDRAAAAAVRVAVLNTTWEPKGVHFTFQRGKNAQTR